METFPAKVIRKSGEGGKEIGKPRGRPGIAYGAAVNHNGFMTIKPSPPWRHLEPKPDSLYRQLFIKGRNIAARTLYGQFVSAEEPRSIEELATDWDLPVEAVREAIAYCQADPPEILADWADEEAIDKASGMNEPDYPKSGRTRRLSQDEIQRFGRR
jgi:hypothetical protein